MPLRLARQAVAAMPDLSQATTPAAKSRALERTRQAERGQKEVRAALGAADLARLEWLRQQTRMSNRELIVAALESYQRELDLRRQLSGPGQSDLDFLAGEAQAAVADAIDFAVRFTATELRRHGAVAVA